MGATSRVSNPKGKGKEVPTEDVLIHTDTPETNNIDDDIYMEDIYMDE